MYRRRRFDAEIIELCVRWYITYRLNYRDLVAMMAERGIVVSHTTIHRWVIRYVPKFEKAMESLCTTCEHVLAGGRDLYQDPRQVELSLSGRRQAWQNVRLSAPARSQFRRRTGILPQGAVWVFATVVAQNNSRWL
jgi:hypothetical protein